MHKEFYSFVSTLPKPLGKQEQEFLLYEMSKLKEELDVNDNNETKKKYYEIREKLISHNLRLCADFAIKHCQKYNKMKDVEDVYGECVVELVNAIDAYDIHTGNSFVTLIYKYMDTKVFNLYLKSQRDALNYTDDKEILDKDEDEVSEGYFTFLYDDISIPEDLAQSEFVNDINNYIENIENERNRLALKMSLGIGYDKKYTHQEIGAILGWSRAMITRIINDEKYKLKEYIALNYPQSLPSFSAEVKKVVFKSLEERDKYIFDSYYGRNGRLKKNAEDLSRELNIPLSTMWSMISQIKGQRPEEDKKQIEGIEVKANIKYDNEFLQSILNDYYGLDGSEMLSSEEILRKYNITPRTKLGVIILSAKNRLKLTDEEIEQLNIRRKDYRDKLYLETCAKCYYMYKGIRGFEKKSQIQIGKEIGVSRNMVYWRVKHYEEYLDSLTPEERESILSGDAPQK